MTRGAWFAVSTALFLATSASTGCATIFKGSTQTITIDTEPAGGVIQLDGKRMKAPAKVTLKRNRDSVVYVSWGDKTVAREIGPSDAGILCMVFAWSFDISLLIVPWIIDLNNDACVNYPGKIVVTPDPPDLDPSEVPQ